jgi:hypothetical protein
MQVDAHVNHRWGSASMHKLSKTARLFYVHTQNLTIVRNSQFQQQTKQPHKCPFNPTSAICTYTGLHKCTLIRPATRTCADRGARTVHFWTCNGGRYFSAKAKQIFRLIIVIRDKKFKILYHKTMPLLLVISKPMKCGSDLWNNWIKAQWQHNRLWHNVSPLSIPKNIVSKFVILSFL